MNDNKISINSSEVTTASQNLGFLANTYDKVTKLVKTKTEAYNKDIAKYIGAFKEYTTNVKNTVLGVKTAVEETEKATDSSTKFTVQNISNLRRLMQEYRNSVDLGNYAMTALDAIQKIGDGSTTLEDTVKNTADSISSALLGSGNAYAMLGGLALKAGSMIYDALTAPTEEEIKRKENLEKTIEVQNKLHNVTISTYKAYYSEVSKGLITLTKLKKLESDTTISMEKRKEATKALITEMADLSGKTEKEIEQLLKAKDGYNALTEAIMSNALAKAELAQYERLLTERLELQAKVQASIIKGNQLQIKIDETRMKIGNTTNRSERETLKIYLDSLYSQLNQRNIEGGELQEQLKLNERQVDALTKGNITSGKIDKTTNKILEAMADIQLNLEKNNGSGSSSSLTASKSPTRFKDVNWRTLVNLYSDPTQKFSLAEYSLMEKEIGEGIKKERETNARALGELNAEDVRLLEEYKKRLEETGKQLEEAKEESIRNETDYNKDKAVAKAFLEDFKGWGYGNYYINRLIKYTNEYYKEGKDALDFFKELEIVAEGNLKSEFFKLNGKPYEKFKTEIEKKQADLISSNADVEKYKNTYNEIENKINALENKSESETDKLNKSSLMEAEKEYTEVTNIILTRKETLLKNLYDAIKEGVNTQELPLELLNGLDEINIFVKAETNKVIEDNISDTKAYLKEFNTLFGREIAKVNNDGLFIYDPNDLGNLIIGVGKVGDPTIDEPMQKAIENLLTAMDSANRVTQSLLTDQQTLLIERYKEWAESNGIKYLRTNALNIEKNELELEKRLLIHQKLLEAVNSLSLRHIANVNLGITSVRNSRKELDKDFDILIKDYKELRNLQFQNNEEILKQTEILSSLYKGSIYTTSTSNKELEKAAKNGDGSAALILNQRQRVGNLITIFNDETNTQIAEYDRERELAEEEIIRKRREDLNSLIDKISTVWDSTSMFGESAMNLLDVISQNAIDSINRNLTEVENKLTNSINRLATLETELENTRSGRREATLVAIEVEKERERALAAEKIKLQNKILSEEKKAAQRRKIWSISQTIIDGALSVARLFVNPTPTSPLFYPLLGLTTATTAANVATIAAQKFKKGGYTSGRIDETGRRIAGVVHQNEYVVPENLLMRRDVSTMIESIESIRNGGNSTPSLFNSNDSLITEFRMLRKSIDDNNNRDISVKVDDISNALNTKSVKIKNNSL